MSEVLVDGHGRRITDLRVSVTDLCNLRCRYCLTPGDIEWLPRGQILRFEEIETVVRALVRLGVRDVRLTGGEPLVRKDLPALARMIARIDGIEDLSLTTNGLLLERDAEALVAAGIRRFNVSLDALSPARFAEVTRRDAVGRVLRGLDALSRQPGVGEIKVNAVATRGVTEHEIPAFVRFARSNPFQVRFIEQMPLGAHRDWTAADVLTGGEIVAMIHAIHPVEEVPREAHATARVYRFADGLGEVGFVNPVSQPFCDDCNRIRLTADGALRTCLFSHDETDLRGPLRDGAAPDDLARIIRDAVWRKELKHRVGDEGFRQPERTMSRIGG
ncbi:MAG: GTP 3',8-cyclase MoaA [Thermoleophilia bacterium]|nr:GTP 3',8-cyclase MoaA [Thermoleophilia bacterium]